MVAPVDLAVVIAAAGRSSRMQGRDKLREDAFGQPLLRHVISQSLPIGPIIVTIPKDGRRDDLLVDLPVTPVAVAGGMGDSLRLGVAALPACRAFLIVLADMPDIMTEDLRRMRDAPPCPILRATTSDGAFGHPIRFDAALRSEFMTLSGDQGARGILDRYDVTPIALPGQAARTDLDTPQDWARWRARSKGQK